MLRHLVRVDAGFNLAGGTGLAALSPVLREPLGLASAWPLLLVAAALLANGSHLTWLARRGADDPGQLTLAGGVDLGFAVAMLLLAAVGLPGQEVWTRWVIAIVADVTAVVGLCKLVGARRRRPALRTA